MLPVQLALAQSVEVSELEKCAGLESDTAKLACYERLADARRPSSEPDHPDPPALQSGQQAVEPQPAPIDDAQAPVSPEPAAQSRQAAREAAPVAAARQMAAEPERASSENASQARDPMEGLGEARREPEVIEGTVIEVSTDSYGRLIFHFDNGQQWRQIEKRYFPYPRSGQFDVTISTGMMGEYRLQVEGAGRKVAIRRLR